MGPLKNAKHEHFAQLVSNGESATRAYVLAGYSEKGARQSAHALLTKPDVSDRVQELRQEKERQHKRAVGAVVQEAAVDKAWVIAQLVENVKMAKQAVPVTDREGNPTGEYQQNLSAANKALELIGKELAMFVDRKEVRTGELDGLEHDDLKAIREALAAGGLAATASPEPAGARRTTH